MSNLIRLNISKRSSSASGTRAHPSSDARRYLLSQIPDQNQFSYDEENYQSNPQPIHNESNPSLDISYNVKELERESKLSLCLKIEDLISTNYELKKDNRALSNKLIENSGLQQKIYQLENHNKQLLKEVSRKDELLYSSQDRGHATQRTNLSQKTHDEIFTHNKTLLDEVRWLKEQLKTAINEKSQLETKDFSCQRLEAQLEETNSQMELLKQDLTRKTYEMEELNDRLYRLRIEKEQIQGLVEPNQKNLELAREQIRDLEREMEAAINTGRRQNTEYRERMEEEKLRISESSTLEIAEIRKELVNTEKRLEQMIERAELAESEIKQLRSRNIAKEDEIENLTYRLKSVREKKEYELEIKERDLEKIIKARTNDAIKHTLQEKVQYEERITHLKETIENLESENAKIKVDTEVEWRRMREEQLKLKGEKRLLQDEVIEQAEMAQEILEKRRFIENTVDDRKYEQIGEALKQALSEKEEALKLLEKTYKELDEAQGRNTERKKKTVDFDIQEAGSERMVSLLKNEITVLKLQCKENEELLEQTRKKLFEREQDIAEYHRKERENLGNTKNQLKEYAEANCELNEIKGKLEEQLKQLNLEIIRYNEKLESSDMKIKLLEKECGTFKTLYIEATERIELERNERQEIEEEYLNKREELERECSVLKGRDFDFREANIRFKAERKQYDSEIEQLNLMNENTKEELEKVYELLIQRKEECEVYMRQNEHLRKENDRLIICGNGKFNAASKEKCEDLQKALMDAEKQNEIYKIEMVRLNKQLEESNVQLSNKIDEVDALKEEYKEAMRVSREKNNELMVRLNICGK